MLLKTFPTEKQRHHQKALEVLLDLLDFASWRRNLDAWKCLRAIIDKLQLQYVSLLT